MGYTCVIVFCNKYGIKEKCRAEQLKHLIDIVVVSHKTTYRELYIWNFRGVYNYLSSICHIVMAIPFIHY